MKVCLACNLAAAAFTLLSLGLVATNHVSDLWQPELVIEHRLTTMETDIKTIKEDLASIKTLGYGIVGAFFLQLVGTISQIRRKGT
jgi:hypothetical protein